MSMVGRFLLDTNIIVAIFANTLDIENHRNQGKQIFVPSIAIGELVYGAKKSGRPQENLNRIHHLIEESIILGCDVETSIQYGDIKNKLRMKGRPLPENDVWIAAIAMQHYLTLVTRDAHFQEVENLDTVSW
jgi:tRNA(fMet)-specific endonuclease VapC